MKQIFLGLLLCTPLFCCAQGNALNNICRQIEEVKSDYKADDFKDDKKETVSQLREYLENKDKLMSDLEQKTLVISNFYNKSTLDTYQANQFLGIVKAADKNARIDDQTKKLIRQLGYAAEAAGAEVFADLGVVADMVVDKEADYLNSIAAMIKLNNSAKAIKSDINLAHRRIDSLYGKLYDDGRFRVSITIVFSLIIGALLLLFFLFINNRYDTPLARDFLSSGNGLQFITLFSLIIAIVLFGVLGILEGRELAAILSGISGYILGKGITPPKLAATKKTDEPEEKTKAAA